MDTILKLEHIQKYYGNEGSLTKAIKDISFPWRQESFLALWVPLAPVKPHCLTVFPLLILWVRDTSIWMVRMWLNWNQKKLAKFRRENLGFVFQDFNLLDTLTISENIALALSINKVPVNEIEPRIIEMAKSLNISDILNKYPYQVSGGQKQRCACARAIINKPKLILADELPEHWTVILLKCFFLPYKASMSSLGQPSWW